MGRFYQALQRMNPDMAIPAGQLQIEAGSNPSIATGIPVPALAPAYSDLAREASVRQVSEQLLAMRGPDGARLIVTGCQPEDGASSIAGALAVDLAERLGAKTLLVDARPRHLSPNTVPASAAARPAGGVPLFGTLSGAGADPAHFAARIERASKDYPVCVIDAGAIRLEPALLGAIDREAPVLIVARYGHTERRHLLATMRAVRASGHRTIGIVFNAVRSPLPAAIHSLFQTGE